MTPMLWLSWPTVRGDGAALQAEALDEAVADVAVLAVALDNGDADDVVVEVRHRVAILDGQGGIAMLGDDLAGKDADDRRLVALDPGPECGCRHRSRLHARQADGLDRPARGEQVVVDLAAGREHHLRVAPFEAVEDDEIGAPAGGDEAAIGEAEGTCAGDRGGAVDRQRIDAVPDRVADHVVEMAVLADVERIAVVGAQRQEGRVAFGDDRKQGVQVLGDGAFAYENVAALRQLLDALPPRWSSRGRCGCRRRDSR